MSEQITRLEDLIPVFQSELLALADNPRRGIASDCVAPLVQLGLIHIKFGSTELKPDGAALVADYHQRQQMAREAASDMPKIKIQCSECGVMFTHMPYHFTGMTTENLCRECYERLLIDEETYAQQHSEPSADLAAQLAAAKKQIQALTTALKDIQAIIDKDLPAGSAQSELLTIIALLDDEIAIKHIILAVLKGTQS